MATPIEEMKPVVLMKYEFEYQEKLKSKRFVFGLFGLSGYWRKGEKQWFVSWFFV